MNKVVVSQIILLLSVLATACTTVSPRLYTSGQEAKSPTAPISDPAVYEQKYGLHDGVYLWYSDISEHSGSSGGEWVYSRSTRRTYMVLKPDVEQMTTFELSLSPSDSLHALSLRVTSPDGTSRSFSKSDLIRTTDADKSSTVRLAYPGITRGSIVEEHIEILAVDPTEDMPLSYFQWLQFLLPCEQLHVIYAYPSWWDITMKEIEQGKYPAVRARRDSANSKIVLEYTDKDIPAFPEEPYAPFRRECVSYLSILVNSLQMGGENFKRVDSWDLYARQVKKNYMDRYPFINNIFPVLRTDVEITAREITSGNPDQLAWLDAIVRYLQKTIQPDSTAHDLSFSTVLEERRGSPFLITGLAQAMLDEVGISSLYLRIHSARQGYFDRDFFSAEETGVPALLVTIDRKNYVVFPYIKHMPVNYLPEFCHGQAAMRIDKKDEFIGLMDLPEGNSEQERNSRSYAIDIDEDGLMTVREELSLTGARALATREALDGLNDEEMQKAIRQVVGYNDGDMTLLESSIDNMEETMKPLVLRCTYTVDNLVTITPDEVIVRTAGLLSPATGATDKTDASQRKLPVRVYANEEYVKDIMLSYPASWQPAALPRNTSVSNRYGELSTQYTQEGIRLHIRHRRILKRTDQPADTYSELLTLTAEDAHGDIPPLIFARK